MRQASRQAIAPALFLLVEERLRELIEEDGVARVSVLGRSFLVEFFPPRGHVVTWKDDFGSPRLRNTASVEEAARFCVGQAVQ